MSLSDKVAVTSRSFSKHPVLRKELLERYPGATFNDEGLSLAGDSLVEFLRGHGKAITALEKIDDSILSRLPELKVISKVGVGLDMLDLAALERRGVLLGWQGGTNRRSVSELALALILASLRRVVPSCLEVRGGRFRQVQGGCLSGRTVGIAGCGNVGKDLVLLLEPFRCELLCWDAAPDLPFCARHSVASVGFEELLRRSDVLSVHLPLLPSTRNILDAGRLALMKPGALLVNTARGGLVDEKALKDALMEKRISAAFDVFAEEPPADKELLSLENFLATPHIGGSTEEAVLAMGRAAIAGLDSAGPALACRPKEPG